MNRRVGFLFLAVLAFGCGGSADLSDGGTGTGGGTGGSGTGGSGTGGAAVDARLANMAAHHNAVRANATPVPMPALPPMTWADDLAASAQAYANKCIFAHDKMNNWGENLSVNWPPGSMNGEDTVQGWESEKPNYNYTNNTCAGVCGHYTQLVWRTSTEVGCGVKTCAGISGATNSTGEIWVCRYRQPGNFNGQRPY